MGRPLMYGKKVRANVTDELHRAVQREAVLTGTTPSDVVRSALTTYFEPKKGRRAKR